MKYFTKRLYGFSNFNYTDTLEKLRLCCDPTLFYKMIYGICSPVTNYISSRGTIVKLTYVLPS